MAGKFAGYHASEGLASNRHRLVTSVGACNGTRVPGRQEMAESVKKDPKKSPSTTGGPVVKNGPTGGQNRARNKDGQWRGKRSDTGKSRG